MTILSKTSSSEEKIKIIQDLLKLLLTSRYSVVISCIDSETVQASFVQNSTGHYFHSKSGRLVVHSANIDGAIQNLIEALVSNFGDKIVEAADKEIEFNTKQAEKAQSELYRLRDLQNFIVDTKNVLGQDKKDVS